MATTANTVRVTIAAPTAPNVVLITVENIVTNLRGRQAANIQLPSIYRRAHLIAYQTDDLAIAS